MLPVKDVRLLFNSVPDLLYRPLSEDGLYLPVPVLRPWDQDRAGCFRQQRWIRPAGQKDKVPVDNHGGLRPPHDALEAGPDHSFLPSREQRSNAL